MPLSPAALDAVLESLLAELEAGDLLSAGVRLARLDEADREATIARARQHATLGPRFTWLLAPGGRTRRELHRTGKQVEAKLERTEAELRETGGPLAGLGAALADVARLQKEAAFQLQRPVEAGEWASVGSDLREAASGLRAVLPSVVGLAACARAVELTGGKSELTEEARAAWTGAHAVLLNEAPSPLLEPVTRVLQMDALRRWDLDALRALSVPRPEATQRQLVIARLERALLAARQGGADAARASAKEAIALAASDADLAAHARFVACEVEWLFGERRGALDQWAGIVAGHSRFPTPAGTCRAALAIARVAREGGDRSAELASLRVACAAALELGEEIWVERAFLSWGRALVESGATDVVATLLARLRRQARAYPALAQALNEGILDSFAESA